MIVSLPLRGITHRILISDDAVTFADPAVSPPLTAEERDLALRFVAARRRTEEPAERMLARALDGARQAAAIVIAAMFAGCLWIGMARAADDAPVSPERGAWVLGAIFVGIIVSLWVPKLFSRPAPAPEPFDSEDDWGRT